MEERSNRTPIETIESPLGVFELLEGGVIYWTVATGTLLDEVAAQQAYDAVAALASGEPIAIIGDARSLGFADTRARGLLADSEIEGRVATGIVVSNPVIRFLAERYARQVGKKRTIRVFDSEAEAIAWGRQEVQSAKL